MYSRVYHTTDQVIIQRVQYMPTQLSYKGYIFKSTKSMYIIFRSLAHLLAYSTILQRVYLKNNKEYINFWSLTPLHAY